jgi:hypothetical protein
MEDPVLRAKAVELAISTYDKLEPYLDWEQVPNESVDFLMKVAERIYNFLKGQINE